MNKHNLEILEINTMQIVPCRDGLLDKSAFSKRIYHIGWEELNNRSIYKFIKLEYVKRIIEQNKLYFARISSWDDKYENYMLKNNYVLTGANTYEGPIVDHLQKYVYGQSWTTCEESDTLWRIYSADERSVRIKVNAKKLVEHLFEQDGDFIYAGVVDYYKEADFEKAILADADNTTLSNFITSAIPASFFRKRKIFQHENEFRIIRIFPIDVGDNFDSPMIAYSFNSKEFIEEITFDSRLSDSEYEAERQELKSLGIAEDRITKSSLYSYNPITINLVP